MRCGRSAKSVATKLEKARARGKKVLLSPKEKRTLGLAGPQADALASEATRWLEGWRVGRRGRLRPQPSSFQTENKSFEAPRRLLPTPAPLESTAPQPRPASCPAAWLTSTKPPTLERGNRGAG